MRFLAALTLSCAIGAILPASAQDMSEVDLLPGWRMENGNRMAGIRVTLAPGWKTYWRAPQGNGIPPAFDWSGSSNVSAVTIHWPRPEVFDSFGLPTIGYHDEVVFPVEIVPETAGAPVELRLSMFYGVCSDVCVPTEAREALDIAPAAESGAAAIRAALATTPIGPAAAGITGQRCSVSPAGDEFELTTTLDWPGAWAPELVVIESGSEEIWIETFSVETGASGLALAAHLTHYGDGPLALDRGAIRTTLLGPGRAVEISGCPS